MVHSLRSACVLAALWCAVAVCASVHDRYMPDCDIDAGQRFDAAVDVSGDGDWEIEAMLTPQGNREGRRTVIGLCFSGHGDTLATTVEWRNTRFGEFDDRRVLRVSCRFDGADMLDSETDLTLGAGDEPMSLWLRATSDGVDVYAGVLRRRYLGRMDLGGFRPDSVCVTTDRRLTLDYVYMAADRSAYGDLQTAWTVEEIFDHCRASADPLEGVWRYLDRENEPSVARIGGNYIVATVRNDSIPSIDIMGNQTYVRGYDILYISGAQTLSERWQPGMVKGRLRPTIFHGNYDLEWYDARCEPVGDPYSVVCDNNADFDDAATPPNMLTLNFPLLRSRIRLARVPRKQY